MSSETNGAPWASGNVQAYLLLTLTTLGWGANAVFGRLAVGEVSPMALTCLRWLIALLLLGLLARKQLLRDWPLLRPRLWFLAAMGSLGFTAFNGLFYVAAHSTSAVNIGIIQGSIPIFVMLGAFAVYRLPITGLQGVGVTITIIGVMILASGGELARLLALAFNQGDLLMVVACLLYAAYTVGLKRRPPASALALLTVLAVAAFLSSIPLAIAEAALGYYQWPTARGWLVVAGVAIIPSVISQACFIRGVSLIGPSRAGIWVNLVPVFAAILAVVFLQEPFEPYHALALVLVLGGIAISERSKAG